jgi:DNA polymerase alpha subunit B
MAAAEINQYFAPPDSPLPQDVVTELQHIAQLLGLSPEDLYYKWDSYVITMGADTTKLDYKTVRDFKKTLQDAMERESRSKQVHQTASKRTTATPRAGAGGDMFGMMDGMMSNTPSARASISKRKSNFDTPTSKSARNGMNSSPADNKTPISTSRNMPSVAFDDRKNAGDVIECLNAHLPAANPPEIPPTEPRIKLKAASDLPKFTYKPMAMKLSEASETLDDRIDIFTEQVQNHYELEDSAFGNPAAQSTAEIVAVGRIACDQPNGKLNASSLVLETSRRMGAGMRVPLQMDPSLSYDFFPGKIVALRGMNPNGEFFRPTEVLPMPLLPPAASLPSDLANHNARLEDATGESPPLNLMIASGPYTTDTDLSFAPLHALLNTAATQKPDLLLLSGPFLDLEHPLISAGDVAFLIPESSNLSPDRATLTDIFRLAISQPINALAASNPSLTIVLVPSLRDAVMKTVSWPQDRVLKSSLGLRGLINIVSNPICLSLNEILLGTTSTDALSELRRENVFHKAKQTNGMQTDDILARLSGHVLEQSHFFPVFPPAAREDLPKPTRIEGEVPEVGAEDHLPLGANLDLGYLKLGEFWMARPDLLVLPSGLSPFAKVVESTVVVNPGTVSKKRGAGTYAVVTVGRREVSEEEAEKGETVGHEVYGRARVEIRRI